jgi:uncharacterized protein (DUF2267 family)
MMGSYNCSEEVSMQAAELIRHVCDYGDIQSRDEASRAFSGVMQALRERLGADEMDNLFAQLPNEITQTVPAVQGRPAESFGLDEFLQRVGQYAQVDEATALRYSRGVLSALQAAISQGELGDMLSRLPREFDRLFSSREAGSGS